MYIKIENNNLSSWADWAFEGSSYVDIDYDYFNENQDSFKVIDGVLTDISNTDEYKSKKLEEERNKKLLENKQALEQKESLTTSFGVVKVNTPIGRVDVMATGFLNLVSLTKTNLPAGSFRTYSNGQEVPSPEMTPEQVGAFYLEIFNKLNTLDKTYKQYESQINESETMDELDSVVFDYSSI